jgi:autotransporter-associated beta strand protein
MKPKPALPILALTLIGPATLHAQSTWIGADGANWSVPANWSGGAPVDNGTSALVFDSPSNRVSVNGLVNLTASSLTINSTSRDNTLNGNRINLGGTFTVATGNWQFVNLAIQLTGDRTFAINSGRTYLAGELSGASGKITKTGGGDLYISGTNSIGSAERLLINSASTVHLESAAALGAAGGSIRFGNNVAAALVIRSDSAINSYNLAGGSSGTGGTVTLHRATSGAGYSQGFAIVDLGSRSMTFNTGSNVSSGSMTADIGELRLTAGNNDRPVVLGGTATLAVGSASITSTGIAKRLQLDGTSNANTIGVISNGIAGASINLIKANSGTWTLTAANTFSGSTEVNDGTLRVNGSLLNTSSVTVGTAGTLGGTGSINSSVVVGGTLAPGVGIESLATGALSFLTGGKFAYELRTATLDGDLVDVAGNLGIASGVTLDLVDLSPSTALGLGTKLSLISYSGVWNGGTFSGLADEASVLLGANLWRINYNDSSGGANLLGGGAHSNFVTLTVIPEPTSAAMCGLLLTGLAGRRRRH